MNSSYPNKRDELSRKQLNAVFKTSEKIHKGDAAYQRASNYEFVIYILAVLIVAFAVRLFVFEPVSVLGESMTNTLLSGERMFVEKVSYCFTEPKRGEIIICYYPDASHADSPDSKTCVKRVVGLPGEKLEIRDGITYINDIPLDETAWIREKMNYERDFGPITVPEKHVFVMGDNRNGSKDSRNSAVGPIPYYRIVGRSRSVIWPIEKYKVL